MREKTNSKSFNGRYDNELEILCLSIYYLDTAEEAHVLWAFIKKELGGKTRRQGLIDLSQYERTFVTKEVRRAFGEYLDYFKTIEKAAFVVTNPVIRMLVKATMTIIDTGKVCRYFKTEEEALSWLKE